MSSETKFKVIGKSPVRHDGTDKVTGRALYGADMNLPGMLYGKVLRSPHPHASCLLYTSPSPRDATLSRMASSA